MLLENIAGHCIPKRAMEVAVCGNHSILFIGPRGAGKDALLAAGTHLVAPKTFDARAVLLCWCGDAGSIVRQCKCSTRAAERYQRRLDRLRSEFDIVIEVAPVPTKELLYNRGQRETTETMRARIARTLAIPPPHEITDDAAVRMYEMVCRRMGLGIGEAMRVRNVASTITAMHGGGASTSISARAIAEAAQYRGYGLGPR